jgi:hypothetical protein
MVFVDRKRVQAFLQALMGDAIAPSLQNALGKL